MRYAAPPLAAERRPISYLGRLPIVRHHSIVVSIVFLLSLLLPAAMATAQDATPAASPTAGQPLDLAAMALTPDDVDIPGLGSWSSQALTLDQEVASRAEYDQKDPAVVRESLVAAGWQRQYQSILAAPEVYGTESSVLAQFVLSYVREFADAEGASAGLAFLEDESGRPSASGGATPVAGEMSLAEDIPGTRVIGDESEITRHLGIDPGDGRSYRALDLTFRTGNLVAGVSLYDYLGGEPDVAEIEALAQTYLERIEQVRAEGAPGLSNRVVRLDAPGIVPGRDDYLRLDGVYVPYYNESPETTAFYSTFYGDAIDLYFVSQSLPAGSTETGGDDVTYENYFSRFADEAAATDYLAGTEERLAGLGGYAVEALPDAATIGDESRTFAITGQAGGQERRGYELYARVGNEVVDILIFAQPEAPLAAVEELARAQVACLQSEELCARMPVPAALAALTPPATPAAGTPVAATDADEPLDLGAMVVTPADLEAVGLTGFGQQWQTYWESGDEADPVTATGAQRVYQYRLAVPVDPGATPDRFRTLVYTDIEEYADAADAAAEFALIEAPVAAGEGTPVPRDIAGTRTIGDASTIRRYERVTSDTGLPFLQLNLAFQRGNLIAAVGIAEYTGEEPDLATLESLADTLLAKIDAVAIGGGPGLQSRTLRLTGQDLATSFDSYIRIAGETLPNYNETAEQTAEFAARLGDATDIYAVVQQLTGGTEDQADDVVFTFSSVYRFATAEAATAWLRGGQERLASQSTIYLDVTPVDGAPTMGDESAAYSLTIAGGESSGFVYYARVGRDVAVVRLVAQPAVPLEAAVELAVAQVACLRSVAACVPMPVPADLVALEGAATPVAATPVS